MIATVTGTVLMQDHPGWTRTAGRAVRAVRAGERDPQVLAWLPGDPDLCLAAGGEGVTPTVVDRVIPPAPGGRLAPLAPALAGLGVVLRLRTPCLWEAIATAVIRQVIRAGQARLMYERFCQTLGDPVPTDAGTVWLFPTAQRVLGTRSSVFVQLGMKFKLPALTAAAAAYLDQHTRWEAIADPAQLVAELQHVQRIGPWTAGAAVADYSGNFALYPYADLAVRTWARRAAPDVAWPDTEHEFAQLWRGSADLSDLTLSMLAWGGSHAHHADA